MADEFGTVRQVLQNGLGVSEKLTNELARAVGELVELQNSMAQAQAQAENIPGVGDAIGAMDRNFKTTVQTGRQIAQTVQSLQGTIRELLNTVNQLAAQGEKAKEAGAGQEDAGGPQTIGGEPTAGA